MAETKLNGNQLNKKIGYFNFSMNNYIVTKENFQASYSKLDVIIKQICSQKPGSFGQAFAAATGDNANLGWFYTTDTSTQGGIDIYDGSSHVIAPGTLTTKQELFWLRFITENGTTTAYRIQDNNYTMATVPMDISQWSVLGSFSSSSFTWTNKKIYIGLNSTISHNQQDWSPSNMVLLDFQVKMDDTIAFDLQDESLYDIYGNVIKQERFE